MTRLIIIRYIADRVCVCGSSFRLGVPVDEGQESKYRPPVACLELLSIPQCEMEGGK